MAAMLRASTNKNTVITAPRENTRMQTIYSRIRIASRDVITNGHFGIQTVIIIIEMSNNLLIIIGPIKNGPNFWGNYY